LDDRTGYIEFTLLSTHSTCWNNVNLMSLEIRDILYQSYFYPIALVDACRGMMIAAGEARREKENGWGGWELVSIEPCFCFFPLAFLTWAFAYNHWAGELGAPSAEGGQEGGPISSLHSALRLG
jgi:hypothetical protein